MEAPIFANSSYLVIVAADRVSQKLIGEACSWLHIRTFFCSDSEELKKILSVMRRVTGVLGFAVRMGDYDRLQTIELAREHRLPLRFITSEPNETLGADTIELPTEAGAADTIGAISRFVGDLTPKGLSNVLILAAGTAFPSFFPELSGFRAIEVPRPGFDRQVNFSLVAGELLGHCAARANGGEMKKLMSGATEAAFNSAFQEAINQSLGIVVQQLVKVGVNAKVGLPTLFDLSKIPEVSPLLYFPSIHIEDSQCRMCLSLGFYSLDRSPLFDFSNLNTITDSGEVDFL